MSEVFNVSEKEISKMLSYPLKTLRRLRYTQKFGKAICFTYPHSCRIMYNIENFKKWYEENKGEPTINFNALIRDARARFLASNPEYTRKGPKRKIYRQSHA